MNDSFAEKEPPTGAVGHRQDPALAQPSGIGTLSLPVWSQPLNGASKGCYMKDKLLVGKKDKSGLGSVVLWGAFASAVLAGLGGMRWAALAGFNSEAGEAGSKLRETIAFDPFALTMAGVTSQSQDSSSANMSQDTASGRALKWPPVRIPCRPALRSPFQPPLVPAATSSRSEGPPQPKETTAEKPAIW